MAGNDLQHLCALSHQQSVINNRLSTIGYQQSVINQLVINNPSSNMLSHTLMDMVGHLADSIKA
jgi:hypothetical protein